MSTRGTFGIDDRAGLLKIGPDYYEQSARLRELAASIKKPPVYAGRYLGKETKGVFFPSVDFLQTLAQNPKAPHVVVSDKAAWLFICGRDLFGDSITWKSHDAAKGVHVLVNNQRNECLGWGTVLFDEPKKNKVFVKNMFDIGSFLRRES